MKKIMIIAGEPSGDLHASNLALELKKQSPDIEISGTGGEKMRQAGVKLIFDLRDLAVTGLLDVIKSLSKLKKIQDALIDKIETEKPDLLVLVDYPDFNLRLAKRAKKEGIRIIYYISPQVWAWRKGRIRQIKKYVDKMIVIFKFEEELYKKAGVDVEFVGHPLLDIVKPTEKWGQFPMGTVPTPGGQIVALLPGSRRRLVKKHLPIMLEAAKDISDKLLNVHFFIAKSPSVDRHIYDEAINEYINAKRDVGAHSRVPLNYTLIDGNPYDTINTSDAVIVTSGTATLETAILEKPMVIIYKLPLLEYLIARPLLRLKHIGLVNIVAGEEIVPEFLQFDARPDIIADAIVELLQTKEKYDSIKNKLISVKNSLYPDNASRNAALSIIKFMAGTENKPC